jgi:hypothetical protein
VIALLALAASTAAGIVVGPIDGQRCPSLEQLKVAIETHVVSQSTVLLRLQLESNPGELELHLVDASGKEVLTRQLHTQLADVDCRALADTVAFIVDRYLDELETQRLELANTSVVPGPAPSTPAFVTPPPNRPWAVAVRVLGKSGRGGLLIPGAEVWGETAVPWFNATWTVGAALGLLSPRGDTNSEASVSSRRWESWFLLKAGPSLQLGWHRIGLQAEIGGNLLNASRRSSDGALVSTWGAEPLVGVSARYHVDLGRHWFMEASFGGFTSLVRHELVVETLPEMSRRVIASTPRFFSDLGFSLGLQF